MTGRTGSWWCVPPRARRAAGAWVPLSKADAITARSIPHRWKERWHALRRAAGWNNGNSWQPDVCRHTFATYHAVHFRNFAALQLEMGHRGSTLLRTRYVYMRAGMRRVMPRNSSVNSASPAIPPTPSTRPICTPTTRATVTPTSNTTAWPSAAASNLLHPAECRFFRGDVMIKPRPPLQGTGAKSHLRFEYA